MSGVAAGPSFGTSQPHMSQSAALSGLSRAKRHPRKSRVKLPKPQEDNDDDDDDDDDNKPDALRA